MNIKLQDDLMKVMFGARLIDHRLEPSTGDTDPDMLVLDFDNGQQIEIWLDTDNTIRVEWD